MRAEAREHVDARNDWLAAHWNDLGTTLTSHAIDAGARRTWRDTFLSAMRAKPNWPQGLTTGRAGRRLTTQSKLVVICRLLPPR